MYISLNKREKIFLILITVLIIISQSCADLSSDPNSSNSKIQISSPSNNGTLMEGNNEIIYSIAQPYSIKFIELYVNSSCVEVIQPHRPAKARLAQLSGVFPV